MACRLHGGPWSEKMKLVTKNILGVVVLGLFASAGCSDDKDSGGGDTNDPVDIPEEAVPGPSEDECGSVRLTSYTASSSGYCEFDRTQDFLPDFVLEGLTLAIAEPYNGSSYGGEPGEACGECWEIDTLGGTHTVMVHDLCPIEGNPLCAGGHFHFDLSEESAAALDAGGLDEGQARRVPCPVDGNIRLQLLDRNEWGYLRFSILNHRFPVRTVEYRRADAEQYVAAQRSGGAWNVLDDNETFSAQGPGGIFRLTAANGTVIEGEAELGYDVPMGEFFDLGMQFPAPEEQSGQACEFVPPGDVYEDGWGGIDQVRWQPNPWGDASITESDSDCSSGSCVRVDNLAQWSGFHLYYRQAFPVSTFKTLRLKVRALEGTGEVSVSASLEGERCSETKVSVSTEYRDVEIDVTSTCSNLQEINEVTADNPGQTLTLLLDEIRFEQ